MEEHLELTDDRQGVVIEQAPGAAQEVVPGDELGRTEALGVSARVTEHLLL